MSKETSVTVENVSFYAPGVAAMKKDDFVKSMLATKNFRQYTDQQRKSLFEKAHELCLKSVGTPARPAAPSK